MHDFSKCLEQSHLASDLPIWKQIYKRAFPEMCSMVDHRADGMHQRAGIDRSVILDHGKQVWIDEKIRGRNKITNQVYADIALEHVSNDHTKALGWVCKPLLCDFIAYAIGPLGKAYLLPVPQLQLAWSDNRVEWRKTYGDKAAQNRGYKTIFTPVPVDTLFRAIGKTLRIDFDPIDFKDGDLH